MNRSPQPTVADLFCGAGGMSLGFSAAGCRIILGIDHDVAAGQTFHRNFSVIQPDHPPLVLMGHEGDLAETEFSQLPCEPPDVLVAGPPCQGFSRVGRAKIRAIDPARFSADPLNDLYLRFLEAADAWQPRAVVMENVPGMVRLHGVNVAMIAAADLSDRGYRVGYARLNAVWYGVPQFRERFIMIGIRDDLGLRPTMPPAIHHAELPPGSLQPIQPQHWTPTLAFARYEELPVELAHAALPATTVAEALDDLAVVTEHLSGPSAQPSRDLNQVRKYRSEPHSGYARMMRAWPGLPVAHSVTDQIIRRTPRDYETFRLMKPGDRYPEAYEIAQQRFREALAALAQQGRCPVEGSPDFEELKDSFVPPYPVDQFLDKWRKLIPDQPCWTVPAHLAKDSYSHIHHDSEQARAISIREAARLQSFPDAFIFEGNMGDCFRQIGNALPPLAAHAIALELLHILGFETPGSLLGDKQ